MPSGILDLWEAALPVNCILSLILPEENLAQQTEARAYGKLPIDDFYLA
jgi:hypothetical protein